MTPRQSFYPQVVLKFYHTMTSQGVPNQMQLQFSVDGRPGILRASNITAALGLPVVLANSANYRQWPHSSPREMVRSLSQDTAAGSILVRRQLPPHMLLTDLYFGPICSHFSIIYSAEELFLRLFIGY